MSSETLPRRRPRQRTDEDWFNIFKRVLNGDLVPRNIDGIASANSATLGTDDFKWKNVFILSGHFGPGDIFPIFDYNEEIIVPHGWMFCDGRQITEANYDTEHGAGTWDTHIGTSLIVNKYLPNMDSKFVQGTTNVLGGGAIAIPDTVGNHLRNIAHTHSYSVNATTPTTNVHINPIGVGRVIPGGHVHSSGTTPSALSSSQSVTPRYISIGFWMRII